MHSLKKNTVRKTQNPTRTYFYPLSSHIIAKYRYITVCDDVIKFSGIFFFVSISNKIFLCTVEYYKNGKVYICMSFTGNIQRLAAQRGFIVVHLDIDG